MLESPCSAGFPRMDLLRCAALWNGLAGSGLSATRKLARAPLTTLSPAGARNSYIMLSSRGSTSVNHGQYVTMTRKANIVRSQGMTAIVRSVMPMREIPEAT